MDYSRAADWSFPVPIRYGPGRLSEIAAVCARGGAVNPLIVTDRASRNLPFITSLRDYLQAGGVENGLFTDVSPNPTDREIAAGQGAFRDGRHDGVIAIGGGSGMDAGKAICLIGYGQGDVWDFDFDAPPAALTPDDFPLLVCIPTTAGTGAETESTAMVTHTTRGIKGCVWHPALKPYEVILDPELTFGLPPNLTAWTGIDALVHAIEAYCVPALHPMCDGIALEALGTVFHHLPDAINTPNATQARGAVLAGSCLAGVAFLKGLGLVHAISHMVGAEYDTHHGLTNAIILPVVLRYNRKAIADKIAPMCHAMGLKGDGFDDLLRALNTLLDQCDIPKSLSDLGVKREDAGRIAQKAFGDVAASTNPAPASVAQITALIEEAIDAARA